MKQYIRKIESVMTNKYFIGIIMIIINIGSRFIVEELSPSQRKYINKKLVRRIFIFCVFFMATKDLIASLILTLMFVFLISSVLFTDSENDNTQKNIKQKILNDMESSLTKNLT